MRTDIEKFERRSHITGIGQSEIGRRLYRDPLALTIEACRAAITDAGLKPEDIDGLSTYPGMLDNMVAGGQPVGLGLLQNVIKESAEEAAVPADISSLAKPVGAISYQHEDDNCLKPDTMFVFDMELPKDFIPTNTDGELAGFKLLPVREVMEITADTAEFKFNCAAVNVDFFVRHGILGPEDPDYIEIQRGLHQ